MHVGVLGGTGPAGSGLALRLASVGLDVTIGSRSKERAAAVCDRLTAKWPDKDLPLFVEHFLGPVAAMADACWRAYTVTGDRSWWRGVTAAANWFTGDNDTGLPMYDDVSGGGFDGLQPEGVNLNQGAESTLALISTMQRARSFAPSP